MTNAAVVLLSGGLDSATAAAVARRDGFDTYALSISYGQRHVSEVEAAQRVADHIGATDHKIVPIDLRAFGGSALTADIAVPKDRNADEMRRVSQRPTSRLGTPSSCRSRWHGPKSCRVPTSISE